jgi:hypothetical protein
MPTVMVDNVFSHGGQCLQEEAYSNRPTYLHYRKSYYTIDEFLDGNFSDF